MKESESQTHAIWSKKSSRWKKSKHVKILFRSNQPTSMAGGIFERISLRENKFFSNFNITYL